MNFILASLILFFANVLMANACETNALQAALKADGKGSSGNVAGGSGGGRAPASAGGTSKVEKGTLGSNGNPLSDHQITMINGRAAAIESVTGRTLTQAEAIALLNGENAKAVLGADYKYFVAEQAKIGGAAALKAEEVAAAKALAAAEAQKKAEALAEQNRKAAAAEAAEAKRRADPNYNPYLETDVNFRPPPTTIITKTPAELERSAARNTLAAQVKDSRWAKNIDRSAYEQSSVYFGVKATMDNYAKKISQLEEASKSSGLDAKVKASYSTQLKNLKLECANLTAIVQKAGLVGAINNEVESFVATTCR